MKNINYSETQYFPRYLYYIVILAVTGTAIMLIVMASVTTEDPAPLWMAAGIYIGVSALMVFLFTKIRLETEINSTGIKVKFFPFILRGKSWAWNEIKSIRYRQYSALWEFGGWGIRRKLFKKEIAYNIRGNDGIEIILKDGWKIMIGTSDPDRVKEVLSRIELPA